MTLKQFSKEIKAAIANWPAVYLNIRQPEERHRIIRCTWRRSKDSLELHTINSKILTFTESNKVRIKEAEYTEGMRIYFI